MSSSNLSDSLLENISAKFEALRSTIQIYDYLFQNTNNGKENKIVPSELAFLPLKDNLALKDDISSIDSYLDQKYINELNAMNNSLSNIPNSLETMRNRVIAFSDERKDIKKRYENYYLNLSDEIKKAYEQKNKYCIIERQSINSIFSRTDKIFINDLEKIAMKVLIRNLKELGYVTSLEPKYKYEADKCCDDRACPEYKGWLVLTVKFQ